MVLAGGLVPGLRDPLAVAVAAAVTRVDLCSPYLGAGTAVWLAAAARRSAASWSLLTRLDAASAAYGSLSLDGLRALHKAGVAISTVERLHAKVFLCDRAVGFLGSGNLTDSGLGGACRPNLELSVALDTAQCVEAATVLGAWSASATPVTLAMIDACEQEASRLPVTAPRPAGGAAGQVDAVLRAATVAPQVWIKAMYLDTARAAAPWGPDSWVGSQRRRPSFEVNDLLLIYGTFTGVCNSIVRVSGTSRNDPDFAVARGQARAAAERWPWITPVEGLLQVPVADGVPLSRLGLTGLALQNGHRRMPTGGLAVALRHMTG